ncbi:DUF3240 family protein [Aquabacterium sp. CECT 9606]|uniref:DUF3240 family protein n=1 Tax=Aquabacterium sp. CECT 9606 TaxID=2845822 RepID=UPI001E2EED8D|nr:DUF3240 family protein [Aquabacterium sp. CECT 9606]CAH0353445.1 hypothetical protein AQB9606_03234 [Aquabacterium sp. CECT 9606]
MSKFCLTVICAREIEEKLLDTLLTNVEGEVFTSTPTFSHGTAHGRLSSVEKVMGRSRSVQVQIITGDEALKDLIELLKQRFKGTGLRYWASALSIEGEVA